MITDAILTVLLAPITFLIGLLPEGSTLGLDSSSGIWIGYTQFNAWLPLTEVLAMVGVWFGVQVGIYAYLGLRAIRGWLPFI